MIISPAVQSMSMLWHSHQPAGSTSEATRQSDQPQGFVRDNHPTTLLCAQTTDSAGKHTCSVSQRKHQQHTQCFGQVRITKGTKKKTMLLPLLVYFFCCCMIQSYRLVWNRTFQAFYFVALQSDVNMMCTRTNTHSTWAEQRWK